MNPRSEDAVVGAERSREGRTSTGPRYWFISEPHCSQTDALTPGLLDGGRVLPVFSFEEEGEIFLRARWTSPGDWKVREVGARELLPVLLGPSCAGVEKAVLDPIAGVADAFSTCLVGVSRERFAQRLLECLWGRPGPGLAVQLPRADF